MSSRDHHNVYVVLLDDAVLQEPALLAENPNRRSEQPCVYVGSTGLSPEQRLENHLNGYKASRIVERYGIRLLPDLYEDMNPMSYEEALETEALLARNLRMAGYTVTGGH